MFQGNVQNRRRSTKVPTSGVRHSDEAPRKRDTYDEDQEVEAADIEADIKKLGKFLNSDGIDELTEKSSNSANSEEVKTSVVEESRQNSLLIAEL